jgi:hypothetical protein
VDLRAVQFSHAGGYAGDIPDFGRCAPLKGLATPNLRPGVHWYLNPDEERNATAS